MPCYEPLPGYRTANNKLVLWRKNQPEDTYVPVKCGHCIACRTAKAQGWTLRCLLENQQHSTSVFTTLTIDDARNTGTLEKQAYSLWIKRLREKLRSEANVFIRHFGCGEYGEQTQRPHYHAIIFGGLAPEAMQKAIEQTWTYGLTHTVPANRNCIAYTAGYVQKKIDQLDTGPVNRQRPFLLMSRRPGIGGKSRIHWQNWKEYAIDNGTKMPVPRFLHEAWKNNASFAEADELAQTRAAYYAMREPINLTAHRLIAEARRNLNAEKRKL